MPDGVVVVLVLAGCAGAYFLIGDLFDRLFGSSLDAEKLHRRRRRPWSSVEDPSTQSQIDRTGNAAVRNDQLND